LGTNCKSSLNRSFDLSHIFNFVSLGVTVLYHTEEKLDLLSL
jgi:hypothetical protein